MTESKSSKTPQGGGELSGLLRKAERLQRELEKAQSELRHVTVVGTDAGQVIRVELSGEGGAVGVQLRSSTLNSREIQHLEEAVQAAVGSALEKLFTLRRQKLGEVTGGLNPPSLFS